LAKADQKAEHVVRVEIDASGGKGLLKDLGGAQDDRWNERLVSQLGAALPGYHGASAQAQSQLTTAAAVGLLDFKPKDAVEAMLGTQMIAANSAALDLYRRAWVPEQNYEVRAKYLALADKAARTVAVLSDALDKRRGRGQQHITVRHVTVNAEQAVVADTVINGPQEGAGDGTRKSQQPHALANAPGETLLSPLETERKAVPVTSR
jgi:hypothetical protein